MSKLRASGGYRGTVSFQTATIIYDATFWFCEKFMDSRSRTVDQMIQAARSGRQWISGVSGEPGSVGAGTRAFPQMQITRLQRAGFGDRREGLRRPRLSDLKLQIYIANT